MSELPDIVQLAPREEADRLWKGAAEAFERAREDFAKLTECLDLGIRAAEIYAILRLQPVREQYPATIASLLESPSPEIDIERDAIHTPRALRFKDVLDMLSADGLDCVSPGLHHGWEDPRFSCQRSRNRAAERVDVCLDATPRDQLLFLLACRNRIFHVPPPVRIPTFEVIEAFPTLARLVENLSAAPA